MKYIANERGNMNPIDNKELKKLFFELKRNDKIAFEKLYIKYNKLIYSIAFSILKNKTDAEDIVQTVFTKIYTMGKEKLPRTKEASWLYSLTRNETISFLRKKNNDLDIESIYEIEDDNNQINEIIDYYTYNKLINKLNEKEKEIVSLKILADLSFDEIGKMLNEPTGTIKWRYYKSVYTLRILLSNLGMFIITFVIGLKALYSKERLKNTENIDIKNENDEDKREDKETQKTETDKSETKQESTDNIQENEIKQETLIPNNIEENENNYNYLGIGILSFSTIFLILTIIFSIILTKHQLKARFKTSK